MSDLYEDDENDTRLVRDLRKQLRDAKQREEALTGEVTELKSSVRKRTVEEALASKGVDKRIAQFIPADTEDVDAWLEQNGDLFGVKANDDSSGSGSDGLSPDAAEAARKVQQASGGGSAVADRQKQQLDAINKATTREELDALVYGAQSGN